MAAQGQTKGGRKGAGKKREDRQPLPDEDALWRHVVRDTKPLKPSQKLSARTGTKKTRRRSKAPATAPATGTATASAPRHPRQQNHPRGPSSRTDPTGGIPGLDKRSAQKMKRGRTAIEGRIDLHGMTQAQAHDALDRFIDRTLRAGKRCVLVITGKGRRAHWEEDAWAQDQWDLTPRGVLREAAPNWLRVGPQGNQILAIEPARPQHGGEGAFYVLLRRKRT